MSKIRYIGQYNDSGNKNFKGGYDGTPREGCFFWMNEKEEQTHVGRKDVLWGFKIRQLSDIEYPYFVTGKLEIIYEES